MFDKICKHNKQTNVLCIKCWFNLTTKFVFCYAQVKSKANQNMEKNPVVCVVLLQRALPLQQISSGPLESDHKSRVRFPPLSFVSPDCDLFISFDGGLLLYTVTVTFFQCL